MKFIGDKLAFFDSAIFFDYFARAFKEFIAKIAFLELAFINVITKSTKTINTVILFYFSLGHNIIVSCRIDSPKSAYFHKFIKIITKLNLNNFLNRINFKISI